MPAPRPSRGPIQLPKAQPGQVITPELWNNFVRALEQQLNALFQLNNNTLIINPDPTYVTSIAGDSVSTTKLRDFTLTVTNMLKNNNKLN